MFITSYWQIYQISRSVKKISIQTNKGKYKCYSPPLKKNVPVVPNSILINIFTPKLMLNGDNVFNYIFKEVIICYITIR